MDIPSLPVMALVPVMSRERFCELSGIEEGVVQNWIDKGYLPSQKIGKRRVVNIVQLIELCSREDQ